MGPFLKFRGPVIITLVPSTAVGLSLSLSRLNSNFINRPDIHFFHTNKVGFK